MVSGFLALKRIETSLSHIFAFGAFTITFFLLIFDTVGHMQIGVEIVGKE